VIVEVRFVLGAKLNCSESGSAARPGAKVNKSKIGQEISDSRPDYREDGTGRAGCTAARAWIGSGEHLARQLHRAADAFLLEGDRRAVSSGKISIRWRRVGSVPGAPPRLLIEWRESGGPRVVAPARRGFGSVFVEASIAADLRGTSTIAFDEEGVRCTMELPSEVFA